MGVHTKMSRSQKSSSGDSTATHPYVHFENLKYGNSKPEWEKSKIVRNEGTKNIWTELYRNGKLEYRLGTKPETK